MYIYYQVNNPFGFGYNTCPLEGLVEVIHYDGMTYIPEIGQTAWAELHYNRKLGNAEIVGYQLVEEISKNGDSDQS